MKILPEKWHGHLAHDSLRRGMGILPMISRSP